MAGENLLVVDDSPTILKVVESALTRAGYRVDTALDAGAGMALARTRRPALILVDSLIPNTSPQALDPERTANRGDGSGATKSSETGGTQLCRALANDSQLARTPVVLMTPKGEDLESRYARTPNIIDYITKPFSPEAMLAVVSHAIEKAGVATDGSAPGSAAATPPPPNAVAEAFSRSLAPDLAHPLARLRSLLAEQLERYRQESGAWDLAAIAQGALGDESLSGLLADAGFEPIEGGPDGPDLAGQLGAISLTEVLTLLAQEGHTGVLRLTAEKARVEVYFRKGRIDLGVAVGVAEEFLLGRFAVEAGHLASDALTRLLDERARTPSMAPLFGRDLVARGLLTPERLKQALRRQTAELVYETLRWSHGRFQFRRATALPELATDAVLDVAVDALLLEGLRRIDEWRLIERDIQSFDLVFVRADERIAELPRGTLTREEIAVLDALSGRNSVRDVIRGLKMGSFDVSKILYRLLRTKLIRRRIQAIAAS